uniref:WAT1-related protein At4g08300-like n=1 Tax=Fragaria vesca subsp. vesca TaxID=101020 RepID=UPI0005C7F08A|nr:PREDICTED: WAT1-related protein At4g08300-like [Fragaria vesca subsp. vesca]
MTLYKGIAVITTHTKSSHQTAATSKSSTDADWIKGSLVLIVAYSSLAAFYILQTSTIKMYPAPITLTSLTCLSGTLLSTIMAAIPDHKASSWKLSWNTILAPMYSCLGAFLVVLGLYATLWGKKKDKEKKSSMDHGISQQANEINLENKKENEIH